MGERTDEPMACGMLASSWRTPSPRLGPGAKRCLIARDDDAVKIPPDPLRCCCAAAARRQDAGLPYRYLNICTGVHN
eukprot:6205755-Pleurochrysis_carterae.AAC.1